MPTFYRNRNTIEILNSGERQYFCELAPYESLEDFFDSLMNSQGSLDCLEMTTTAPLEMLRLYDESAESLLQWVRAYGIPQPVCTGLFWNIGAPSFYESDRIVCSISVQEMKEDFLRVRSAVQLWRGIATKELETTEEIVSKLCQIVNEGTRRYPSAEIIEPELEKSPDGRLTSARPKRGTIDAASPMAYIWGVIRSMVAGKGLHHWHFKQCADCGKWEDISAPGRRSTWTRCDNCLAKIRTEQARERKRAQYAREATASPGKRPRGRPPKEERPS
jgi:hypothetical protein